VADACREAVGTVQVRPRPPDDTPALVPDRVLAALLPEDGVPGVLSGPEQAPVLDAPVELADEPVLLPGEVGAADHGAGRGRDLELKSRGRELPAMEDDPAPRLAHALAAAVREEDGPGGAPAAGRSGEVEESGSKHPVRDQADAERCVQGDDRSLVRKGPRQIQRRPHGAGHLQAVDLDHLVIAQPRDVTAEDSPGVVAGTRPTRDVHPVERNVPEG
jgi:hypothetical protein